MKKEGIALGIIIFLSVLVRLYRIDSPLLDWHSWRQADTASVSREFVDNGINFLVPTYHDISNVPSGLDNPQGYRFVEFPIYNAIHAAVYKHIGILGFESWGRLISIVASAFSVFFIYALVKRYASSEAGLFAGLFYGLLPFSIYFGRVILPEPLMTMSFLAAIYFFQCFADVTRENHAVFSKILFFVLAAFFAAVALLLKPFAGFFLIPLAVIAYQAWGLSLFRHWQLYVFVLLSLLPLGLWRWWMMRYPEGVPTNLWLFNGGGIRFTGAYFYWIFAERIGKLILGYFGAGFVVLGFLTIMQKDWLSPLRKSRSLVFLAFVFSALIYLFVVARGNVQHDYYQIPIVPAVCMLMGLGAAFLWSPGKVYSRIATRIILVLFTVFTLVFSWYYVRDFFNINNPNLVLAGQAVDSLTPKNAKVIALYGGDTSFLYQTKRSGWSSMQNPLPEMIKKGAEFLVIVNPNTEDLNLANEYEVVVSRPEYLLLKL